MCKSAFPRLRPGGLGLVLGLFLENGLAWRPAFRSSSSIRFCSSAMSSPCLITIAISSSRVSSASFGGAGFFEATAFSMRQS